MSDVKMSLEIYELGRSMIVILKLYCTAAADQHFFLHMQADFLMA